MEPRYLRVKKWRDHQHYNDREPPWIKMQRKLLKDDKFAELSELEQWQLVRIWVVASASSRFTEDDDGRRCPVLPDDEQTLRRAIGTLKRIPLAKLIREGWLIPVDETELLAPSASTVLAPVQAPSIGTEAQRVRGLEVLPSSVSYTPSLEQGRGRETDVSRATPEGCIEAIDQATGHQTGGIDKIRRAAKHVAHGGLIHALEACQGPGVNDPLAVALAELKKRKPAA